MDTVPVSELTGLQTSKYFNFAGMAILIMNYLTTLDEEVRWMWGRSWNVTRATFMVSRYMPFLSMGFTIYFVFHTGLQSCDFPSLGWDVTTRLGIIASEILLILRTYVIWQGNKRVLYGLLAFGCICVAASALVIVMPENLVFPEEPFDNTCSLVAPRNDTFAYAILLSFELVILFLTVCKGFRAYRRVGASQIAHTLYRDGIFYIVIIALVTSANVLLDALFPRQYSDVLALPQVALHSVLASRIMFNLRASYDRGQGGATIISDARALTSLPLRADSGPVRSDPDSELDARCTARACTEVDIELDAV